MKVLCYVDGDTDTRDEFTGTTPNDAAAFFVEDLDANSDDGPVNVVVEPLDEEAGACEGWTTRPDGARVQLFRVTVIGSRWLSDEVHSFDTVPS